MLPCQSPVKSSGMPVKIRLLSINSSSSFGGGLGNALFILNFFIYLNPNHLLQERYISMWLVKVLLATIQGSS